MPIALRRKAKQSKKNRTLIQPNLHSSASLQLQPQGPSLFENHTKKMEETFNGTLHEDTHKVRDSLSEGKKVVHQVASHGDDGKSMSLTQTTDVDIAITDEQVETQDVSESVVKSLDPSLDVSSLNEDTVELELEEEKGEDLLSFEDQVCVQSGWHAVMQSTSLESSDVATAPNPNSSLADTDGIYAVMVNHKVEETHLSPSEDNNELSSAFGNERLRETEVVETIEDGTVAEEKVETDMLYGEGEEPNSNEINTNTDVASRKVFETSDTKSDESDKFSSTGVEKSLAISTDEKVEEQSDVQESSTYESAKESFQTSPYVPDAESNGATQQGKIEEPGSFENPSIIPVTQRQHTTWKSCCGLLEILRHGNRS